MSQGIFLFRYKADDKHFQIETLGGLIVETRRTLYDAMVATKSWQDGRRSAIMAESAAAARRAFERQVRLNAIRRLRAKREHK